MHSSFILGLVLIGSAFTQVAQADPLHAGVARIDLTPPAGIDTPLGGYGERMNRPATGVHDRIFAKAVAFRHESKTFVIVTADLLGFPPPFKPEVIQELNDPRITLESLILLPSHSHTSIEMNAFNPTNTEKIPQVGIYSKEVHQFLIDRFCTVIRTAMANPVPVRVGTSSQSIPGWNRNRRHQGGLTDDDLTLTRIDTADGKSLAILVNFAAHPTFLGAKHMEFSGDWPGQFQRTLEALIGQDTTVLFYNGDEGDQAPVARPDSGPSPWERVNRYGTELAVVAAKVFHATETRNENTFEFHRQEIQLPETSWHPKFLETGGAEYGLTEEILKRMLPKIYPRTTASVMVRVGDLMIIGVPGEMAAELGRTIKQQASQQTGVKFPVIGGLADEWDSYILPASEYRSGGYEASVSFYGETLGATIVEGISKGFSNFKRNNAP